MCRSEETVSQTDSEVTNLIEFITRVIHHQAFNLNRDIRTDTKKILRVGVYGSFISPRQRRWRDERGRKKTTEFITKTKNVSLLLSPLKLSVRQKRQLELFHWHWDIVGVYPSTCLALHRPFFFFSKKVFIHKDRSPHETMQSAVAPDEYCFITQGKSSWKWGCRVKHYKQCKNVFFFM